MGKTRGPYQAEYPAGTRVRIAPRDVLEHFLSTWQFHHPLQPDQMPFADYVAQVQDIGFYHGGDVLYTLRDVPGLWHEQLLSRETPRGHPRAGAIGIGLLSGILVGVVVYIGLMFLGALTGVIAMCSSAPTWWAYTLFGLMLVAPVASAIAVGVSVGRRWYRRRT